MGRHCGHKPQSRPLTALLGAILLLVASVHAREYSRDQPAAEEAPAPVQAAQDAGGTPAGAITAAVPAQQAQEQAPLDAAAGPRRMMQEPAEKPLENTRIPATPAASHFKKIDRHVTKALGTAVNGSAWVPGACGSQPSALGYQCTWVAPGGAVLHWSYSSGSSAPPINRCTMQQQAIPSLEMQELSDATVHFALQAATQEQLHLVFVDPEGRYYPNEGVHGLASDPCTNSNTCKSTSTPKVEVLHQTAPGVSTVTGRPSSRDPEIMEGWAGWASADTDGHMQVLCVSRHVHTKLMKLGPQQSDELLVGYAVGNRPNYMAYGLQKGLVAIQLTTGSVSNVDYPSMYVMAHGALMLIAFGVLLPSGLLLARHKWLFVDEELGLSPLWSLTHMLVLLMAALTGLTGMIVALARFGNTVVTMVMSTHQVLGLLSVGLALVLAISYGLRPFLVGGQRHANSPLLGPQKVGGTITVGAGWASLFLGCVVVHQNWASPYYVWLVPCVLLTALVATAATLLELRYQALLRSGQYNPKTCTLSNAGPSIPLARIRTQGTSHKKQEALSRSSGGGAGKACDGAMEDAHPGSPGIGGGVVAATILARSMGPAGSGLRHQSDNGLLAGRPSSTAGGAGGPGSGSMGGIAERLFRRGRHSTPNAAAAEVQTGFPSSPCGARHSTDRQSDGVA